MIFKLYSQINFPPDVYTYILWCIDRAPIGVVRRLIQGVPSRPIAHQFQRLYYSISLPQVIHHSLNYNYKIRVARESCAISEIN